MTARDLSTVEQILTLVLTDRDGSLLEEAHYRYALGGAILAELCARGRIELEPGASGTLVTPVSREATGDPALDDALVQLLEATRRSDPETWVGRFAEHEELHLRVARQLCRKGAIDEHEGRVRLIFRRTVYVDLADDVREEVVGGVRDAVFGRELVSGPTATVIAFARAAEMLKLVFPVDKVAEARERLDRILEESDLDEEEREANRILVTATRKAVLAASSLAA
jgi:hypothetical protein